MSSSATQAFGQQTDDASKAAPATEFWALLPAQLEACVRWVTTSAHETPPQAIVATLQVIIHAAVVFYALKVTQKRLKAQLLRALGIVPKSERQNARVKPGVDEPRVTRQKPKTAEERLESAITDYNRVKDWHHNMGKKATKNKKAAQKRLDKLRQKRRAAEIAKTPKGQAVDADVDDDRDDDDDEPEWTSEQKAEACAAFNARASSGGGADPSFAPVNEPLMSGLSPATSTETQKCAVDLESLPRGSQLRREFEVIRPRIHASFCVTLINVHQGYAEYVDGFGQKRLIAGDILDIGPARSNVTWGLMAYVCIMIAQQVTPMYRLARMLTTAAQKFTTTDISRYFASSAEAFVPIYLYLAQQLADAPVLRGDDTPALVLEVERAFQQQPGDKTNPWDAYATPEVARETLLHSTTAGDMSTLLAAQLGFWAARKDKKGKKRQLNVSVLSGRFDADDPRSTIVFYRTHIGSLGNLLDVILPKRASTNVGLVIQSDLSTTNLVADTEFCARFDVRFAGCAAHARRPFAIYRDDDVENCGAILHYFMGFSLHEKFITTYGKNAINTVAVRDVDDREMWVEIREHCELIVQLHAKTTPIAQAANYILKNYDKLTYYLTDARVESTNNFSERMLRPEKLIQRNSLFRKTLKGRFSLDIMRTMIQTCLAAEIIPSAYIEWVLRQPPSAVAANPELHTPYAYRSVAACSASVE